MPDQDDKDKDKKEEQKDDECNVAGVFDGAPSPNSQRPSDVSSVYQSRAYAYYACRYFNAVKEASRIAAVIAGIQQLASAYLADKQHDIAKRAQRRLDEIWKDQKDKGDKQFNHWWLNGAPLEIAMTNEARARERQGFDPDYKTMMDRSVTNTRHEFTLARDKLGRTTRVHCVGKMRAGFRMLDVEEAKTAVMDVHSAWRAAEQLKLAREDQYREEMYKWLGMLKGAVTDSLNSTRAATAAAIASGNIDPYAGWAASIGGLTNFGNAINQVRMSGFYNTQYPLLAGSAMSGSMSVPYPNVTGTNGGFGFSGAVPQIPSMPPMGM